MAAVTQNGMSSRITAQVAPRPSKSMLNACRVTHHEAARTCLAWVARSRTAPARSWGRSGVVLRANGGTAFGPRAVTVRAFPSAWRGGVSGELRHRLGEFI